VRACTQGKGVLLRYGRCVDADTEARSQSGCAAAKHDWPLSAIEGKNPECRVVRSSLARRAWGGAVMQPNPRSEAMAELLWMRRNAGQALTLDRLSPGIPGFSPMMISPLL